MACPPPHPPGVRSRVPHPSPHRSPARRAAEFRTVVDQAAQVWNGRVANVRLVAGTPADVVVRADDGWPRTRATRLGRGTIWMSREATAEGYHPLRIATHEIGHILGLPDRRTGLCADLMSGHSAPVSCANVTPSAAERRAVDANFAGSALAAAKFSIGNLAARLFVDPPGAARDPVPAP
ncbi:snapalysin family zinc-dependent metalloprotease [Microbispora hainanensis]|uniref:snapalysin family zinc-dependent metalloprotease n=1 Tax=Microbispora hainanensis TaxID=568844 RepID=UPI0033F8EF40